MNAPTTTHDLYSDSLLNDPYPVYEELRSLGGAVWMEPHNAFALTRFDACRDALRNWQVFSSARGVMMNDPLNAALGGNIMLCTDGGQHARTRAVVAAPLTQKAIGDVKSHIEVEANALIDRLVEQGTFDAVTELAQFLPVTVVSTLVGIPEEGRERMVEWGKATFNTIGPMNERSMGSFPLIEEMNSFIATRCTRDTVRPGSWAAGLFDAADRGAIADAGAELNNYLGPALDTTINATSNMIALFAHHPDQWDLLRERPDLVNNALEEVMRIDAVIQGFSRCTTEEHTVDGVTIPADARVLVLYGSANRDDRHFTDSTRFDIERSNASDHLALGYGSHSCPGGHLARAEMRALLAALLRRVARFDVTDSTRAINNVTRGLASCTVSVTPA